MRSLRSERRVRGEVPLDEDVPLGVGEEHGQYHLLSPISSSSTVLGSVCLLVCGCEAEAQEEEGDGDEFGLPCWAIN